MEISSSFNHKIEIAIREKLRDRIESLNDVAACAGIKDSDKNGGAAAKARMNHYGSFTKKVPARRWVDMADISTAHISEILDLQRLIKELIKEPEIKWSREVEPVNGEYGVEFKYHEVTPDVFPKGMGPVGVMKTIATGMLEAQIAAIQYHEFRVGPTNGNDPAHNAKSTIRIKGKDFPLIDTGEMIYSLSAWTERI